MTVPRVHSIVARAAKRPRSCAKCGGSIEVGQAVYRWARKTSYGGTTFYQHIACGQPRPSQLYSRKTAQIEDLLQEADLDFSEDLSAEAEPGDTHEIDTAHVESVLEEIADVAESVGDEYAESADNLPEGLQQSYQADALRDVAERLRDWARDLRDIQFETTVDLPVLEDGEDLEDWRYHAQSLIDDAVSKIIEEAQEKTGDMPEYEG